MAPFHDTPVLAYEGPFGAAPATDLERVPLSTTVRATPCGGITISASSTTQKAGGALENAPSQDAAFPKPLLPCQTTLKTWADMINARVALKGGAGDGPIRVEVPGSLADKTVSLFWYGVSHTGANRQSHHSSPRFARRAWQRQRGAAAFADGTPALRSQAKFRRETLRLMPEALFRALKYRPNRPGQAQRMLGEPVIDTAKAEALYAVIVQRLRQVVEPRIAASAEKILPVMRFPSKRKDALGLSILAGNADVFDRLTLGAADGLAARRPRFVVVVVTRTASGTLFQFSAPAANGIPAQSMNIVLRPHSPLTAPLEKNAASSETGLAF